MRPGTAAKGKPRLSVFKLPIGSKDFLRPQKTLPAAARPDSAGGTYANAECNCFWLYTFSTTGLLLRRRTGLILLRP